MQRRPVVRRERLRCRRTSAWVYGLVRQDARWGRVWLMSGQPRPGEGWRLAFRRRSLAWAGTGVNRRRFFVRGVRREAVPDFLLKLGWRREAAL